MKDVKRAIDVTNVQVAEGLNTNLEVQGNLRILCMAFGRMNATNPKTVKYINVCRLTIPLGLICSTFR